MGRRIAVFGTGYLGATHAACMAELGHDVLGVDVDAVKLAKLGAGEAPFYEPGLDEVLKSNVDAGRLQFTSSYEEAAEFANVHFIAVATPQKQGEFAADLKYVDAVIETLAPLLTVPAVIFGKSTVPVGTAARLGARARELAPVGDAVEVAWNPEFLREGYAVQDTLHPDRIVLGVDTRPSGACRGSRTRRLRQSPRGGNSVSGNRSGDVRVGEDSRQTLSWRQRFRSSTRWQSYAR